MQRITLEMLQDIRFGFLFRKLALNDNNDSDLNQIEKEIYSNKNQIRIDDVCEMLIHNELKDVFTDKNSSQLLWLYRCICDESGCLLHKMSPYMKEISKTTRGGLNIYKRVGWDIHVLYAYQLICDNFKSNRPTDVEGAPKEFNVFQNMINNLDNETWFVLKLATFMHDIGIVDGVADHEFKGVKWVEKRLEELGYTTTELSNLGVKLSLDEIQAILRFVVGNHQIINQIGSELGDYYVASRIKEGQTSLSGYGLEFFNSNISKILYLISAADLMAVNDPLLTPIKMEETREAIDFFDNVVRGNNHTRDFIKYGIQRYKTLLNDSIKQNYDESIFKKDSKALGYDFDEIAKFIYDVPRMSYAMTFVKPQKEFVTGLKMFCLIYEKIRRDNIDPQKTSLKFDPDIDYDGLGEYIRENSIDRILGEGRINLIYEAEENVLIIR